MLTKTPEFTNERRGNSRVRFRQSHGQQYYITVKKPTNPQAENDSMKRKMSSDSMYSCDGYSKTFKLLGKGMTENPFQFRTHIWKPFIVEPLLVQVYHVSTTTSLTL